MLVGELRLVQRKRREGAAHVLAAARTDAQAERLARTEAEGVFAVGDIVRGASLVVWAIKDGRDCAEAIIEQFNGAAAVAAE